MKTATESRYDATGYLPMNALCGSSISSANDQ
jgi:hypothetical protein